MFAFQDEFAAPIIATKESFVSNKELDEIAVEPPRVISVVKKINPLRFIAAASIILLVISGGLNVFYYLKYTEANEQVTVLLNEKNTLTADNKTFQTKYTDIFASVETLSDTSIIKVSMKGVLGKETNLATIFWNSKTKDVYLYANNLPKISSDKQYQLWALVDGKPVDAGMLATDCNGVCKISNITKAQAFAITLEKKGGSPTPDLTQLQVKGNVKA